MAIQPELPDSGWAFMAYVPELEHLNIFDQGVEAWNRWRQANPEIIPNLSNARLYDSSLKTKAPLLMQLQRECDIVDFTGWKENDTYQKAFERLIRDLKT